MEKDNKLKTEMAKKIIENIVNRKNKISVKEFADLHKTDRQTILRHIKNGWLKAEKKIELSSKAGFIYVLDKKEKFTPRKPGPQETLIK